MVRLEKITSENHLECHKLEVVENQKAFVSSTVLALAKAYVYRDIVTPFAIYDDNLMVGFIMVRFNKEFENYFVWQLLIDEKYQNKGYGRQAMNLAIEWMRKDERCKSIVTCYKDGNDAAKKLYEGLGFVEMEHDPDDGCNEVDLILNF